MTQNSIKKLTLSCVGFLCSLQVFSQEAAATATAKQDLGFDLNLILIIVAGFLLLPLFISGNVFIVAIKAYLEKNKNTDGNAKKIGTFLILFFVSQFTNAQDAVVASSVETVTDYKPLIITAVIIFEALLIVAFSLLTLRFLKPTSAAVQETKVKSTPIADWFNNIWNRMNKFQPITEDGEIDTGHDYDGIRELDNVTPPWFKFAFMLSILFAIVYLYRRHVSHTDPLMAEEYQIEMEAAEDQKLLFLKKQTNSVDENTIVMLGAADIAKGKSLYAEKSCTTCHGADGGSMPGGVGPNLTDDFWLHGGGLKNIFKSIKYGWPEKGMIAWKDQLSSTQMAQIACYVNSIRGTKPANPKELQGDFYEETSTNKADSVTKDTTKNK